MSTSQPESAQAQSQETQSGLDVNVAAALAYVLGFISGIVMLVIESENDRIRFHAAQSIVVFGGIFVLSLAVSFLQTILAFGGAIGSAVGSILSLLSFLISIGAFGIWVYLIVRTYQGENVRIPIAADVADDFA